MSDQYKNMDDFFREKFADFEHEPPEHIWLNVKDTLHKPKGGGFTGGKLPVLALALFIAGSFTLYLLLNNDSKNSETVGQNITESAFPVSGDVFLAQNSEFPYPAEEKMLPNPAEKLKETEYARIEISVPRKKNQKQKTSKKSPGNTSNGNLLNIPDDKIAPSGLLASAIENNLLTPGSDSELLAIHDEFVVDLPDDYQNTNENTTPDQLIPENGQEHENDAISNPVDGPKLKSDYGKNSELRFGLFFTPEVIFYPGDNNFNNRSYSVDLNVIHKFSEYFVQSGIGLAFASDQGKYKIDYNKYIGSYEDVYDVTFDSAAHGIIPTFHTETVNVYDSVTYAQIDPSKNRFTYLQFPVLFGYGKENRRLGWFVKGGPSLSIMISENIYDMDDMEGHKIINVDTDMPSRIETNWQFILSGGIGYKLGNHLSLWVEPMMRYYMKSVYEQGIYQTKHPYSFGLRTGLLLNL